MKKFSILLIIVFLSIVYSKGGSPWMTPCYQHGTCKSGYCGKLPYQEFTDAALKLLGGLLKAVTASGLTPTLSKKKASYIKKELIHPSVQGISEGTGIGLLDKITELQYCSKPIKQLEGDICFLSQDCKDDLFCSGLTKTCKKKKRFLEKCFYHSDCLSGSCDTNVFTIPFKCNAKKRSRSLGETCLTNEDCEGYYSYNPHKTADENIDIRKAKCSRKTLQKIGKCIKLKDLDSACDKDKECKSHFCTKGVCKRKRKNGQPCSKDDHCENFVCYKKTCRRRSGRGEGCVKKSHCQVGLWCKGNSIANIHWNSKCTDEKKLKKCKTNNDCTSKQFCLNSICQEKGEIGGKCKNVRWSNNPIKVFESDDDSMCKSGVCYKKKCRRKSKHMEGCVKPSHCESDVCWKRKCRKKSGMGGPCGKDSTCKTGVCYKRTCRRKSQLFEGCKKSEHCLIPLTCYKKKCVAYDTENGEKCNHDRFCKSQVCYKGRCTRKSILGEGCKKTRHCIPGLKCRLNSKLKKKCETKYKDSVDNGYYCTKKYQCKSKICYKHKCRRKSTIGEGCQSKSACESGLRCIYVGFKKKCVARKGAKLADGKYCTRNNQCLNNICYKRSCRRKSKHGEGCSRDSSCDTGVCYKRKCRNKSARGQKCSKTKYCVGKLRCRRKRIFSAKRCW